MSEEAKNSGPNRRALRPGEWACVDAKCAQINNEKRHSCELCGKSKPRAKNRIGREIGKDAADKSKGLFSADDWVCTKCGNVNWARRSVCNICNAPKLGDLELRTGYGGGYMDRQDVEYIERDDDEEFDEFGRKKRKRNKEDKLKGDEPENNEELIDQTPDVVPPSELFVKELDKEEQEDEGDEDSDDVDLDKYDLTADPELLNFQIDSIKLRTKLVNDENNRPNSALSSNCSCSCSGGECSCVESDQEIQLKKSKNDKDEEKKRSNEKLKVNNAKDSRSGNKINDRDDRYSKHENVRDRNNSAKEHRQHKSRDNQHERYKSRDRHRDNR